jgi:ribose/xylose/arabinose/galactoside ABC-type transport system permease subunit
MGKTQIRRLLHNKVTLLVFIWLFVVVFFAIVNPNYIRPQNILILLKSSTFTGLLGLGVGLLLISGQVDLSTGSVTVLSAVIVSFLLSWGMSWPLAVLLTLLFGIVTGAIVAILVNGLAMMSFIATIGLSSVWTGVALVITRSNPVKYNNDSFLKIGSTTFFNIMPLLFVILLVLIIFYGLLLSQTKFGRSAYMCGGNRNAARLAGINPKKVHSILFINCGFISSLCGVLYASSFRRGDPVALTIGLDAITAAVLGGISFTGGTGGTGGFFIGLMLLSFFNNGIVTIGLSSYWQTLAGGALLILALLFDYFRENQRLRLLKAGVAEAAASKR